jgi:hypothetical protein
MQFKNKKFQKFWRFSTSFQLGIPVIAALMILTIAGTIIESRYDAWTAEKLIYRSWMMYAVMGLLIYNLVIVMVDRLPWKKNHVPFILVHIGIITLIYGGWVTQKFGLDGSLRIPIQKSSNMVTVHQTDFTVYATFDGAKYTKVYDREVDFYNETISENDPLKLDLNYGEQNENLNVVDYVPYAQVKQKIVKSTDPAAGGSVKFQLTNANVKQVETLTQQNKNKVSETTLGLLNLYLGYNYQKLGRKNPHLNEVYFSAVDEENVDFALFDKNENKSYKSGRISIGSLVQTHWMGLEIRLLDYVSKARTEWDVTKLSRPNALTTSAVQITFNNKSEWLLLNDTVKIFTDKVAYIVAYHNRQLPVDFNLNLDQFEIVNYQGTNKAKEYSSRVTVKEPINGKKNEFKDILTSPISMNEPLKYNGYTFYQASFEKDEKTNEPVASIFSVNKDPGRWIKYLGSIVFSAGIVILFYQRRKRRTAL